MANKEDMIIINTQKELEEYIDKMLDSDFLYYPTRMPFKNIIFNFSSSDIGKISIVRKGLSLANSVLYFENCEFHNVKFYDMYLSKALFKDCIFDNFLVEKCTLNNILGFSKCNFIKKEKDSGRPSFLLPKVLRDCCISLLFLDNCFFETILTVANCDITSLKVYDRAVEEENKELSTAMIFSLTSSIENIIVKDIKTYKAYSVFMFNNFASSRYYFKNVYLEKPNGVIEQYDTLAFPIPRYRDCLFERGYHRDFQNYCSEERSTILPYHSTLFTIYYDELTDTIKIEHSNSYDSWSYDTFKSFIFSDSKTFNKFIDGLRLNLVLFDLLYKDEEHNRLDDLVNPDDYDEESHNAYQDYTEKAEKWYINNYVRNYIKTICFSIDRFNKVKEEIRELKGAGRFD